MKILFEGAASDSVEPICRECTGKDRDIPKATFQRFVFTSPQYPSSYQNNVPTKNIRHFVFEVLSSNEWIQEFLSALDHSMDFTTTATEMGIVVKCLPKIIDGLVTRFGTSIDENTYLGLFTVVKKAKRRTLVYLRLASDLWH
jgi:hypothetical protein